MSSVPQREWSDTPKVPRGLREGSHSHGATTRAIWEAQSDERVARAHAKLKIFTKHCAHRGKRTWKKSRATLVSAAFFLSRPTQKYCACHEKWARGIRSPAPATRNHHHVPNQIRRQLHKNAIFDPFKTSPKFTKYCACTEKWHPKAPLIFIHPCQSFSNVQKVPRLPCGWESVRCLAPVTQNDVLDIKKSRTCDACHTKWI